MTLPIRIRRLVTSPLFGISLILVLGSVVFFSGIVTKFRDRFTSDGVDDYVASELKRQLADDSKIPNQAVVFLGDSITHDLDANAVVDGAVNYGIGGMTSTQLLSALPAYNSLHRAKAIVLMIGINDWGHGGAVGLRDRLKAIESALPRAKPLVWNAIMPAGGNPKRMADIAVTNQFIRTLCASRPGCIYVNTWQFLASPDGQRIDGLYVDSLHLNWDGYHLWASALRQALQRATVSIK